MTGGSKITFEKLCYEELSRVKDRDGIGLYAEKRLHSVLKRWMYDDFAAHEKKVPERGGKISRFVADILTPDGEIVEIQTGELYPLARKMAFYMEKTDHRVTLVHPLAAEKWVSWLDPETGEVKERNRSTKREGVLHGIARLKSIAPFLDHDRLTVLFPLLTLEEFRLLDGWVKNPKRRSHRYELIPLALQESVALCKKEDYAPYFPADLPDRFTAKIFGKHTRLRGYDLYDAIAVFEALGFIRRLGKEGRSYVFERVT